MKIISSAGKHLEWKLATKTNLKPIHIEFSELFGEWIKKDL